MQTSMYQKLLVGVTLGSCTCTGKLPHGSRNPISCEVLGGVLREVLAGDLGRSWGSWGGLGGAPCIVLHCIVLCCMVNLLICQPASLPISQPASQQLCQPSNPPTRQPANQLKNQTANQSTGQPANQKFGFCCREAVYQYLAIYLVYFTICLLY